MKACRISFKTIRNAGASKYNDCYNYALYAASFNFDIYKSRLQINALLYIITYIYT